jgi:hypothetical protein
LAVRFLYTDNSTWTAPATTVFDLMTVRLDTMTTAANKRDVWIRCMAHAAETYLPIFYACSTQAEANAITVKLANDAARIAAGVLAYAESGDLVSAPTSFVLTDVAGTNPDMTGMRVEVTGNGSLATMDAVYGYVASPASLVMSKITTLLKARMSVGQILYGFTSAEVTTCHEQMQILSTKNQITAVHVEEHEMPAATMSDGIQVRWSVIVGKMRSNEETGYSDLIAIGGAVRSLLGDEERDLDGLITTNKVTGLEGPTPMSGDDGTYMAVRVTGETTFPVLRRD